MTTSISGSYPAVNSDSDATINGLTVGKGGGAVSNNTVVGLNAGVANTTGKITAVGYLAARFNTTGSGNTAVGGNDAAQDGALYLNTTGNYNIAMGTGAVASNTTGSSNTGLGYSALQNNTTASNNTAVGYQALYTNTTASRHTAVGYQAGYSVTTNDAVTAVGYLAGNANTGGFSVFVGRNAGYLSTASKGTMIGDGAGSEITTGANNTILGRYDGNQGGLDIRTLSNRIVISDGDGNPRIYIAGTNGYFFPNIRSSADANNDLRFNTGNGEIYYQTSSQRYKENIVDLEFDTSNLYNLRPVSYDDKATGNRCYGLIAEETFVQIPNVVVKRDIDGESLPDSIPYSMLSVVIINEMKKLKTLVDTQATLITSLTARIAALENK